MAGIFLIHLLALLREPLVKRFANAFKILTRGIIRSPITPQPSAWNRVPDGTFLRDCCMRREAFVPMNLRRLRMYSPCISRRSEEHTSELQSLMRISYAVFCLKKKKYTSQKRTNTTNQ